MKKLFTSRRALWLGLIAAAIVAVALTAGASSRAAAAAHSISPAVGQVSVHPEISGQQHATPGNTVHFSCQSRPADGSAGPRCYQPVQIQQAYAYKGLLASGVNGAGKTIMIVDAFSNPYIEGDLAAQDAEFGLPAPPSFTTVAPQGVPPFDLSNADMVGWAEEITLDVEWAHAMAPGASIVLVEGKSDFDSDLFNAEKFAVDNHLGDVMSQSFGENEGCVDPSVFHRWQELFTKAAQQGITTFASTGDSGASQFNCEGTAAVLAPSFPADDPDVTGVGGTTLNATDPVGAYVGETAWTDPWRQVLQGTGGCNPPAVDFNDINCSGGGFSTIFARPSYQASKVPGNARAVPDISYDGGVNGGVLTTCTVCLGGAATGIFIFGGTSAGSPQWAALAADADQMAGHDLGNINQKLYSFGHTTVAKEPLRDVTTGNNDVAELGGFGYNARVGWDPVTGLGTPKAENLLPALAKG